MIFNSLEYFIFLPLVYLVYWFVFKNSVKKQNVFLLLASYVFYGWWGWRFLSLIFLSTLVDDFVDRRIDATHNHKSRITWLWVSVLFNVGLLGFFMKYNFFVDSWVDMVSIFGYDINSTWASHIILPV